MAVLIGGIAARTTVFDDATLELNGAWGTYALTLGANTYVYVASEDDDGVSSFQLGSDGSLTNVENIIDDATLNLNDASNLISATVNGVTYLYVSGANDDGISGFSVAPNGTLTNVANIDDLDNAAFELDASGEDIGKMSVVTIGTATFLIASGADDDGFSVFQVEASGALSNTDNVDDLDNAAFELDGAWDTATATIGGRTFIYVTGNIDNGLSAFELAGNGTVTGIQNVADNATLNLGGAMGLTTATVGGTTYLIASGNTDNGLSVFSIGANGQLTNVSNVSDDAARGLVGASSMTTFTLDTETFVVVSGEGDSALTVFHVGEGGALTDVTTIFDDLVIALGGTNGNAFATSGGVPFLIGTGNNEDGFTSFDIGSGDDTLVGTALADILLGLGGNDSLDGGAGDDNMRGGSGNDTYAVDTVGDTVGENAASGTDTVRSLIDYTLAANVENLILLDVTDLSGTGNNLNNDITGNKGANLLKGQKGKDDLFGQGGRDDLQGGKDNDRIDGGRKGDIILGGKGRDTMEGGGGGDDFLFNKTNDSGITKATRDRILDFGGRDDLVFTGIDAIKGVAGNQDFELDGNGNFEAGEIRLREVNAGVLVELNVDGDSAAEMSVLLKDFTGTLNNSDFEF